MGGTCSTHDRDERCIENFGRKQEGMKPKRRWKGNIIKMDLGEIG